MTPSHSSGTGQGKQMTRTILLVEDNADNRSIYRIILEHAGYQVVEALDGEAGVEMARQMMPDLILMDISIPKLDGWEATRILKADEVTRKIPIIALTAHALPKDRERSMEVGCDGYLSKPIAPREVVVQIERFLVPVSQEPQDPRG
jgi:two-component system, cell cycle response regulator DivK